MDGPAGVNCHSTLTGLPPLTAMCPGPVPRGNSWPSIRASTISIPSVREDGISRQTFLNVPDWKSKVIVSVTARLPPPRTVAFTSNLDAA